MRVPGLNPGGITRKKDRDVESLLSEVSVLFYLLDGWRQPSGYTILAGWLAPAVGIFNPGHKPHF